MASLEADTAVIGLACPDRQHDAAGYPKFLFDASQSVAILRRGVAVRAWWTIEARFPQILRRRLHELRLLRLFLRTSRMARSVSE